MDLTADSQWIEKPLTDLFIRHELATEQENEGLTAGSLTSERNYQIRLQAHQNVYHIIDQYSTRALFAAKSDGLRLQVSNFVITDLPFLKNEWRRILVERKSSPVQSIEDLDHFLGLISAQMGKQAAELGLPQNAHSKIKLLNLHVARGTRRLENQLLAAPKFSDEILHWLRAGVEIEHILHFFYPGSNGGCSPRTGHPVVDMEEALSMSGVPIRKLQLLYSNA